MFQKLYNKNRLEQTKTAYPQSGMFFHLWQTQGLWSALKWFHSFKAERQQLSYAWVRVGSDLLGSLLIAFGMAKVILPVILFLVIIVGGSNDYAGEG